MEKLHTADCFRFAWTTFKKRPWLFVGITAFIFFLSFLVSLFQNNSSHPELNVMYVSGFLISLILSMYLAFGQIRFFLKAHDSVETTHFRDFWGIKDFGYFFLLSLLATIVLIIAFLLFIIPGIYLSLVFMFATYILVDTGGNPIDALKESARLTKGNRWPLLLLSLELIAINVIGAVLVLVGLLVTIPLSLLATVHAYRTLQKYSLPVSTNSEIS